MSQRNLILGAYLDSACPTGVATATSPPMLHAIAGRRSSPDARVSTRHGCGARLDILIRFQISLLELRLHVWNERPRHCLIHRTFRESMRHRTSRSHHRWNSIWHAGIRHGIWIDLIVLRRRLLVGVIVSRHSSDVPARNNTLQK